MTRRTATVIVRTSAIERCVTGVLLLGRTDAITGLIAGDQPRPPAWLVRVLGSRLLAQGLLEYTSPADKWCSRAPRSTPSTLPAWSWPRSPVLRIGVPRP